MPLLLSPALPHAIPSATWQHMLPLFLGPFSPLLPLLLYQLIAQWWWHPLLTWRLRKPPHLPVSDVESAEEGCADEVRFTGAQRGIQG